MYEYRAKIIDVYDGDTVTAIVDLGFSVSFEMRLRLYGIDAPELRGEERPAGLITKDRLSQLILNKVVQIKTYKDKTDKYGRYLADIFLLDNTTQSVNTLLINEGLAKPYIP